MLDASEALDVGKRVASDFSEKNVSFMAAGIAYNALVSLAPLLILLLLVVSVVGGGLEERLIAAAGERLPGPIADVVTGIFSRETSLTGVSLVGLAILLWGSLKVFRGLDTAFTEIYETNRDNSFVDKLIDGVVVLVAIVLSILATVVVSAVFAALSSEIPLLGLAMPLVLIGGLILAFFPMYYRFPDVDVGWKDVLPGTVFAALGWAALQAVFQVYLLFRGDGSGSFFGGILVVVTWLYFSGLVLLLGAVLNAVVGGHSSGAPGGVGRGAARDDSGVVTRTVLAGDDLGRFLREFRFQPGDRAVVTDFPPPPSEQDGRSAGDAEGDEVVSMLRRLRPALSSNDEVEVIEWSDPADGEHERTITLRWRPTERTVDE